ncbi:hypothetical protein ASG31_14865 [Chryseobacterium sp. Leaf404]|uniref:hypothetical protein n=1 Tax=unclassified Chryseobacterium TaxID=2593645 RepID=UPI0006F3E35F|nr:MULTISPECIES: hypothetical protein [unclassified Chryseobacterium]KQT15539.1 hypothetical protein ASG31_14865 [Chryseobacterium sp. Leaf404]
MTKNKFITTAAALLLGFLFSCDNTTADPINNSLNNPNNPGGSSGGGATILGPRILHKVTVNNVTNQEFFTTGNTLDKAVFLESGAPNSFVIGRVTYTSGKVTKVKYEQEVNGSVPANSLSYEYNLTYDANGKINYTTCTTMAGTMPSFNSEYTYTYDGSGKMTKIVEKKKSGTTYTHFSNYTITNAGDNISKVAVETGMTSATGVPDMSTVVASTSYNFDGYDTKINPYTTLPKAFFVTWSLLHPLNFSSLSANNVMSFTVVNPSPMPSIPGAYTYLYDSQNYPVSDQSQMQKYIYKAL